MKSMRFTGLAAAAAMVWCGAAWADVDRPDWSFVEIAYNQGSSGENEDNDAIRGGFSIGGWDYVHLQAALQDGTLGNEDFDGYKITLGINPSIGDGTDLVFDVFAGNIDPDNLPGLDEDSDFWGLSGGFRHMMTQRFEVNGTVNYQDSDTLSTGGGSEEHVFASIGGQFNWTNFSGGLTYTIDSPFRDDIVELNFRWSWDDWF